MATSKDALLSDPSFWQAPDREDVFVELRRAQPVIWQEEPPTEWSPGGRGYWAVTRHRDVREVSRRPDTFISALGTELFELPPAVGETYSWLLDMDGDRHTRMRAIAAFAFSPRHIAQLQDLIRRHAVAVIEAARERGGCDFASEIAEPFPIAVICDLMGVPESDRSEIARLSRMSVPQGDEEFGTFEDALRAALELIDYAKGLQQERRLHPADDLTTTLMNAEVDGKHLTEDEVGSYFELLITAGIETTGTAIAHGMLALSRNPDQWRRLRNDFASLAPLAVEEILRWSTPIVHFRRTAVKEVELGGERIHAGDKVVMFYNSANRDESVFEDPYRFDIERSPNPHLTFGGGGRHMCLGAHLGRLELRIIFEELSRRAPDLEIGEPVLANSMFVNGVKSLPCTFSGSTLSARTTSR
ncbi:MAG: cytochrome P450 [Acidimicrobiales bacterium]